MAVQTTYSERHAAAAEGMPATMVNYNIVTGQVETSGGIGFGKACCKGTADMGVTLGGTSANFIGVSVRDPLQLATTTLTDKYPQYSNIAILTLGEIWVKTYEAVSAHGAVYFDGTTGLFGDTDTTDSVGPVTGARWKTSAGSGELAVLVLGIQK